MTEIKPQAATRTSGPRPCGLVRKKAARAYWLQVQHSPRVHSFSSQENNTTTRHLHSNLHSTFVVGVTSLHSPVNTFTLYKHVPTGLLVDFIPADSRSYFDLTTLGNHSLCLFSRQYITRRKPTSASNLQQLAHILAVPSKPPTIPPTHAHTLNHRSTKWSLISLVAGAHSAQRNHGQNVMATSSWQELERVEVHEAASPKAGAGDSKIRAFLQLPPSHEIQRQVVHDEPST